MGCVLCRFRNRGRDCNSYYQLTAEGVRTMKFQHTKHNDKVRITAYVDRELRDRFKEILRDADLSYSKWLENTIQVELAGAAPQ